MCFPRALDARAHLSISDSMFSARVMLQNKRAMFPEMMKWLIALMAVLQTCTPSEVVPTDMTETGSGMAPTGKRINFS